MIIKAVRILLLVTVLCIASSYLQAQTLNTDTLTLTLKQAENQFIQNNLQLIIERYNIDNASAQVITARLFPNPDFNFSNGIAGTRDPNTGLGPLNEQTFGVSQLIQTAGKRNKSIQLAKIQVRQAGFQFFDLLRTLKYTLRSDFYTIYFQEQSAKVYTEEINSLAKTLKVFKLQYASGNIAEKEVLRIQSQLYSLQSEYNGLLTSIDTTQNELKTLIRAKPGSYIVPVYNFDTDKESVTGVPYQQLLDSAYTNRYDLKNTQAQIDYNNVNLELQKAQAVPDFSLSLGYDRAGAVGQNFLGAGIEFNLPFFNRNQGGIKQARIAIDQSKVQLQNQQEIIQNQISTYYKGALRLEGLYNNIDPNFKGDFTKLIRGVFENYQKRNISLLEFLDFYDSYKNNTIQLNNLQQNKVTSLEQLNYVTGTSFFNKQ